MKKNAVLLCAVLAVFLAASCASAPEPAGPDGSSMPEWVLSPPVAGEKFFGVGYAQQANQPLSIRIAETRSRTDIANQIEVTIQEVVQIYSQESGTGDDSQLLEFVEATTRQVTDQAVRGSIIQSRHLMDDGGVWVLAVVDTNDMKRFIAEAIDTTAQEFSRTEEAAFSEWKAQQAFEYMDRILETSPPQSRPVRK